VNHQTVRQLVPGPAGAIECAIDLPPTPEHGVAVICHPHPQHGGTMDNKVAQTLARAAIALGWRSVRFNFRGVGASEGHWDEGRGEIDGEPLLLAGFSFGAYVASQAAARLPDDAKPQRLALVGPSTQKQRMPAVPADTVVIHGEADDVVPLSATLEWARPQALPVIVFPGTGHFFHGQLGLLKNVLVQQLRSNS
jgi:alpha/beta superfamily hydrolase